MASRAADNAVEGSARWMIWRRWRGPRTSGQRLAVAIVALALMIALVIPLFEEPVDKRAPAARAGVVDYSAYGRPDRPVQIAGQWRLTWFEPALAVGGSIHSPDPSARMVILNGQVQREGDTVGNGLVLKRIRATSAVFEYRGQIFEMPF